MLVHMAHTTNLVSRFSHEHWEKLKAFQVRHDDLILSSYPRSGATWTQQIIRLLRNCGKDDGTNLDDVIPLLDSLGTDRGNLLKLNPNAAEELESPRALRSHLPYLKTPGGVPHNMKAKYVYIARNPKDVCVSYWHFHQTQLKKLATGDAPTLPWDEYVSDFVKGKSTASIYGSWIDHVLGWWAHRCEPNILFLKYEDVKKEPHEYVRRIADFMDMKDITSEVIDTVVEKSCFSRMWTDTTVNNRIKEGAEIGLTFLRKGVVGDWKNYFTDEQSTVFDEEYGIELRKNGLHFEYD